MEETFKQAMSRFATGVCTVTYEHPTEKRFEGVTISAFSSLSLSPLKILFCLGNQGAINKQFAGVSRFAVNILNSEQKTLAYQFAGNDYSGLATQMTVLDGIPVVKNTLATVICNTGSRYVEGDHDIIIGDVTRIELGESAQQPLLYFKSTIIEDYQYV